MSSGSDHIKSHITPSWGTSTFLFILLIFWLYEYIVHLLSVGRKPSMHAENWIVDDCCEVEIIKDFSAVLPNVEGVIFAQTFIIKAVKLSDLSGLVVASNKHYLIWISHFQSQKQLKGLNTIVSSVYIISQKNIIRVRQLPSNFEQF